MYFYGFFAEFDSLLSVAKRKILKRQYLQRYRDQSKFMQSIKQPQMPFMLVLLWPWGTLIWITMPSDNVSMYFDTQVFTVQNSTWLPDVLHAIGWLIKLLGKNLSSVIHSRDAFFPLNSLPTIPEPKTKNGLANS